MVFNHPPGQNGVCAEGEGRVRHRAPCARAVIGG